MKTNHTNKRSHGFTLIEMVGVLAVIAILAAILVPKIFAAINESRVSDSVAAINSAKSEVMRYYAAKNVLPSALTDLTFEKPFAPKVGSNPAVASANGKTTLTLEDVAAEDAFRIGEILDKANMQADATTADAAGIVQYTLPANGVTVLTVTLAER